MLLHATCSKHVHAKFQLSSFYPDGLRPIFDQFSSKFQNFLEKISNLSNSEKKMQVKPILSIFHMSKVKKKKTNFQVLTEIGELPKEVLNF
jgi:hypothetical protein